MIYALSVPMRLIFTVFSVSGSVILAPIFFIVFMLSGGDVELSWFVGGLCGCLEDIWEKS